MRRRPALLQTTAAAAWIATVTGAFTGYDGNLRAYSGLDERIWFCCLGIAVVSSLPAVLGSQVASRIDGAYVAIAKSFATRPRTGMTGPLPALDDAASPLPGQLHAVNGAGRHTRHGTRASRV